MGKGVNSDEQLQLEMFEFDADLKRQNQFIQRKVVAFTLINPEIKVSYPVKEDTNFYT